MRASVWLFPVLSLLALTSPAAAECTGRTVAQDTIYRSPVCIPEKPSRIVALDSTYNLIMSLELGLPVIGAPLFNVQDPDLLARARASGVEDIGSAAEPSVERIVALQPDLILGDAFMHGSAYDLAIQVAPTVLVQAQNWKTFYMTIAEVTGTQEMARQAFATYERRAADIRAKMPDVSVSVLRITPFGFQVYLDGPSAYAPFAVLGDAGVKRPAYEVADGDTILKRPDWEGLSQLTGDVLLYMVGNPYDDESKSTLEADTLSNPLWKAIPAVAAGRVQKVDIATWMGFGGLDSANKVLDDVERFVVTAK